MPRDGWHNSVYLRHRPSRGQLFLWGQAIVLDAIDVPTQAIEFVRCGGSNGHIVEIVLKSPR